MRVQMLLSGVPNDMDIKALASWSSEAKFKSEILKR